MKLGPVGQIVFTIFFILWIAVFLGSLIWLYKDVRKQGKGPGESIMIAILSGLLFWPFSIVLWLLIRRKFK